MSLEAGGHDRKFGIVFNIFNLITFLWCSLGIRKSGKPGTTNRTATTYVTNGTSSSYGRDAINRKLAKSGSTSTMASSSVNLTAIKKG